MASSADSWVREYNEAVKLADDINGMMSEMSSLPASGPEAQRHASAIRRKITILGTRLDSLQSLVSKLPSKQPLTEKEMNRRRDMLSNLRSKVNQMASALNMSNFASRDSLLGPEIKPADAMSRASGLDNYGVVAEQDEGLDKLEETVISTKHIALAVNEELDLHTRLIDNLDQHVDVTDSRLQVSDGISSRGHGGVANQGIDRNSIEDVGRLERESVCTVERLKSRMQLAERVQKNLAILSKRTKGGCSCLCLFLSVAGIAVLVVAIYLLCVFSEIGNSAGYAEDIVKVQEESTVVRFMIHV
ncbi:hypothetical protein C3L33_09796, partial [Rhododendron williamsianum]